MAKTIKYENAEEKLHYEQHADPHVYLDDKQMALASKFFNQVLREINGNKTWMNNAMGVGRHSSKYMGQVFSESTCYRASQWIYVVNRTFWRLPAESRKRLEATFQELLNVLAFPKLTDPKPKVNLDTEPEVVQKRRKKVMEGR